jgi:LAO/AO transport system kinase
MMFDRKELTKLVSRLENGEREGIEALKKLYPRTGKARIVGITGPPGVGKSTLIDQLISEFRRKNLSVAVVAVDPTSPITGGALLGDRLRMQRHSEDEGVFIRSLATRNHHGGLTDSTPQIVHALDAAGFDIVIVETVGTGQDEVEIAEVADTVVVVLMPELGDEIQRAKAGLMEIADILVVNKSDLGMTKAAQSAIHTSAKTGDGIGDLAAAIEAHWRHLRQSKLLEKRRRAQAEAELARILHCQVSNVIVRTLRKDKEIKQLAERVARREVDPYSIAEKLVEKIFRMAKRS